MPMNGDGKGDVVIGGLKNKEEEGRWREAGRMLLDVQV